MNHSIPTWAWLSFGAIVLSVLVVDLLAHRGNRVDSFRRALLWSGVWIGLALVFGVGVFCALGRTAGQEYLGAWLMEKSLSVDTLFVFLLVFRRLGIPPEHERRVLSWGVFSAFLMRGVFVAVGTALSARFRLVFELFGALLLVTAVRMLRRPHAPRGWLIGRLQQILRCTRRLEGKRFLADVEGRTHATPLLVALLAVELTDMVFALDSIPAAFAITRQPFIVYTSNVFALLGLRSLYLVVARAMDDLRYLRHGLAAMLAFAGVKMLLGRWVELGPLLSLCVIVLCMGTAVTVSVLDRNGRLGRGHSRAAGPFANGRARAMAQRRAA